VRVCALCVGLISLAGGLLACGGALKPAQRVRLSAREIVDRSKPAIVRIDVLRRDGVRGIGTGFVVSSDGRIVTNLHVIQQTKEAIVTLVDGSEHPVVRVVSADPRRDLAVIEIAPIKRLKILRLGNSDEVAAGDLVIAIGNPHGFDYSVSDGLISSVRSFKDEDLEMIQISAPISLGSSGGPLFNRFGEVIGVAVAISSQGQNLNFGIPSNYLLPLIAARGGSPLERFDTRVQKAPWASSPGDEDSCDYPPVSRKIPVFEVAMIEACSREDLAVVFAEIRSAIQVGAPLYNPPTCRAEACFRIYEGVALKLRHTLSCEGITLALAEGMSRAETQTTFHAKAWAMRDTFDGILDLILRWARNR